MNQQMQARNREGGQKYTTHTQKKKLFLAGGGRSTDLEIFQPLKEGN